MALNELEGFHGAVDIPDPNDFSAEHLLGAEGGDKPPYVNLNIQSLTHNQGSSMHCTAYAITHAEEILEYLEKQTVVELDPEEQWKHQKENRGNLESMEKNGDSLQNALKTLLKCGLQRKDGTVAKISGYAFVDKNVENFKKWLAQNYPIYTGWKDHCFILVGYDDTHQCFIAKNSYGPTWGKHKDGTFDVPYADILKLFSGYILYDTIDTPMIFRDVSTQSPAASSIQFVLDKALMMGYGTSANAKERFFRPDQAVTRAELAIVLERFFKLMK